MTTLRSAEANSITAPTITPGVLSEMKARQSAKIRELGQALIDAEGPLTEVLPKRVCLIPDRRH